MRSIRSFADRMTGGASASPFGVEEDHAGGDLNDAAHSHLAHRHAVAERRGGDRHAARLQAREGRGVPSIGSTTSTVEAPPPAGSTRPRSSE